MDRRVFALGCPIFLASIAYNVPIIFNSKSITVIATVIPPKSKTDDLLVINNDLNRLMKLDLYFAIIDKFKNDKLIHEFSVQSNTSIAAKLVLKNYSALAQLRSELNKNNVFNYDLIKQSGYRIHEVVI